MYSHRDKVDYCTEGLPEPLIMDVGSRPKRTLKWVPDSNCNTAGRRLQYTSGRRRVARSALNLAFYNVSERYKLGGGYSSHVRYL
jgi:hypothetical protein